MSVIEDHNVVHVVIAIIENSKQEVLVSERKLNTHMGGLLEFPGGKVENNETPEDALRRELVEELNIDAVKISKLIKFKYSYSDRKILIDTYKVCSYSGEIVGNEGQKIFWRSISSLRDNEFPAANKGVIRALKLPQLFPVTPDYSLDSDSFLLQFEKTISNQKIKIIQLRSHEVEAAQYKIVAHQCATICKKYNVRLILNRNSQLVEELDVSGIHLTGKKLLAMTNRPLDEKYLVGASCHNDEEIQHANNLGLDYIFVGAVLEKISNKNVHALGWDGFAGLVKCSLIPAYAIGGVGEGDTSMSSLHGGQGVAAIRSFWSL